MKVENIDSHPSNHPIVEIIDNDDSDIEFIGEKKSTCQTEAVSSASRASVIRGDALSVSEKRPFVSQDGPLPKKSKYIHAPSGSAGPSERRNCEELAIIDLVSDSDDDRLIQPQPVPKKCEAQPSNDSNSDSDYDMVQAALAPNDPENWKDKWRSVRAKPPTEGPMRKSFHDLCLSAQRDVPDHSNHWGARARIRGIDPRLAEGPFTWNILCKSRVLSSSIRRSLGGQTVCRPSPQSQNYLSNLHEVASFRQAPGPTNKIKQNGQLVAICTCTTGGFPDREDEMPEPYNKSGSLILHHGDEFHVGEGHRGKRSQCMGEWTQTWDKFYVINDVAFDPTCWNRVISSGSDCTVRVWQYCEDGEEVYREPRDSLCANKDLLTYVEQLRCERTQPLGISNAGNTVSRPTVLLKKTVTFDGEVNDLCFKPDTTTLAVGCNNGMIYIYSDVDALYDDKHTTLALGSRSPKHAKHVVASMVWGCGPTSHLLFASSEAGGYSGHHKAFDVIKGTLSFRLNAQGSGDALAIDSEGERLALFTVGTERLLQIFDARGRSKKPTQSYPLEESLWPRDFLWDVNSASYSDDGVYLVAARSDNISHVYDSRMLVRGPLHAFEHRGRKRVAPGASCFGIVEAQWVETSSRKLSLVTGGIDGCIRIWDVMKSTDDPANGTIIARMDSDVSYFSVGDIHKGEKALVVGDCGNAISIFERKGGFATL